MIRFSVVSIITIVLSDYHQQGAHQGPSWPFRLGPLQHGEQPRAWKRGLGCEETVGGRKVRKMYRLLEQLRGVPIQRSKLL